jgi:hypothetical protein
MQREKFLKSGKGRDYIKDKIRPCAEGENPGNTDE